MGVKVYLLICLIEECAEIIQRICKAIRFGLEEVQEGQSLNNQERIIAEISDFAGVIELLKEKSINVDPKIEQVKAKQDKLRHWMSYSKKQGVLK